MEVATTLNQFSDRLSPVFVRDLRQGLRARYFVWAFIVFQILALLATLVELSLSQSIGTLAGGFGLSGILQLVLSLGFGLVLPLTLFGALQTEVGKGRNIELLLTSSLTRWQIVGGKFLVASALSGLLLISLLPYLLLRYFLGSIELLGILGMVGSVYLSNMTMNAIVIGASGFASHIGRIFVILYFSIINSLTIFAASARFPGTAAPMGWETIMISAASFLGTAVVIALGLQLGRARIKLFESPIDPPTSAGVFALAFLVPVAGGIATGVGGFFAYLVVMALLLWLILLIDRGRGRKNWLKGSQP